ncbi:hypothetical protein [Mucilaginibacter sp.]|uniref:hypothetical protein n=1 Tax=Mucilaginibacter sp. TaxID=1882438 RepID=UPI000CAC0169|nr:hypothetical protein [Mucilaginibacter sp.]PLW90005.1 MAG: hypothetical protein C0154_08765 [Mucilaginibacter sp.]PMP65799.1 MAG: hypothetical protein C0191_02755 [Mucilaginibacter sp.]
MNLTKYKITAHNLSGYMMVIYQDDAFKSVLNEFKPALTEKQLNVILSCIPNDPAQIQPIFKQSWAGKLFVEPVKAIGSEPDQQAAPIDYPAKDKIALWCRLYEEHTKDEAGTGIKYKTGAAEAGKIKALAVTPDELEFILKAYFVSKEWFTLPKSISNFIKKYNEIRAMAYSKPVPKVKNFPLPFDPIYFHNLNTNDQRLYWDHLRANGYKWVDAPGRGGKWEKQHTQ